jgi:mannose-1-phosphate guanylyltransferase
MSVRGGYSWNSGMFIWKTETILAEIARQMPKLNAILDEIAALLLDPKLDSVMDALWLELDSETIDYGIMEKAKKIAVLPASGLDWSDVGNWDSLYDVVLPNDAQGNVVVKGKMIAENTRETLVYGTDEKRLIVTIGVEDLIIVDSGDVLLIANRDQAQDVRKIVDKLTKENRNEYL